MERAPNIEASAEQEAVNRWRELKATAPEQAEDLISHIEGFADMTAQEQLRALQALLVTFASERDDEKRQSYRELVEEIAVRMEVIKADDAYQKASELGAPVPTGRVLTEA